MTNLLDRGSGGLYVISMKATIVLHLYQFGIVALAVLEFLKNHKLFQHQRSRDMVFLLLIGGLVKSLELHRWHLFEQNQDRCSHQEWERDVA